jgi:hypothetical protein
VTIERIGKHALAIRRYDRGSSLRSMHESQRRQMDERHRAERETMIARHQIEIAELDPMIMLAGIDRIAKEARAEIDALISYIDEKKAEVA